MISASSAIWAMGPGGRTALRAQLSPIVYWSRPWLKATPFAREIVRLRFKSGVQAFRQYCGNQIGESEVSSVLLQKELTVILPYEIYRIGLNKFCNRTDHIVFPPMITDNVIVT